MGGTVNLTVLVTGATGRQGGSVARLLINRGHRVRAFTRRPDSPPAQDLKRLGAEIFAGDFDDYASVERAARGADAAFLVANPWEAGPDAEARQAVSAAEAIRAAGVAHLVYSSVAGADSGTGIPHFDSKQRVERRLHALDIPFTIVAPVTFMENVFNPSMLADLRRGKLSMALPSSRRIQLIGLAEIAGFTALVLERREEFFGKRIDIASDDLTGVRMAEILSKATGRLIEYAAVPIGQLRVVNADFAKMYEWIDRVGYNVDISALRRQYPAVGWRTFEQWARAQNWSAVREAAAGP